MGARSYEVEQEYRFGGNYGAHFESSKPSFLPGLENNPVSTIQPVTNEAKPARLMTEDDRVAKEMSAQYQATVPALGKTRAQMIFGNYAGHEFYTQATNDAGFHEEKWKLGHRIVDHNEHGMTVKVGLKGLHEMDVYTLQDPVTKTYVASREVRPSATPDLEFTVNLAKGTKNFQYKMSTSLQTAQERHVEPAILPENVFYQAALRDPGAKLIENIRRDGNTVYTDQVIVYSDTYTDAYGNIRYYGNETKVLPISSMTQIEEKHDILPQRTRTKSKVFDIEEALTA